MHCPVASDHVVSKHIWTVHAEHNLWPWEDKASQHAGTVRELQAEGKRVLKLGAEAWRQVQTWDPCSTDGSCSPGPGADEGNQNLQGRPLAWPMPESEPGCFSMPVIKTPGSGSGVP